MTKSLCVAWECVYVCVGVCEREGGLEGGGGGGRGGGGGLLLIFLLLSTNCNDRGLTT